MLKVLKKNDMLPTAAVKELRHLSSVDDRDVQLRLLADLDLSSLDIPLLRDARHRLMTGAPDRHNEMCAQTGSTVYEVRDRTGAAWRGAVVQPVDDETAWLVYVDTHDRFHSTGPKIVRDMAKDGRLGPSELDRRIRDIDHEKSELPWERASVLESLIDALTISARTNRREAIRTSGYFSQAELFVHVSGPVDPEWDAVVAHQEASELSIQLKLSSTSSSVRDELIRTCVPFLQPDMTMWEALYRAELEVQVIVTRAGLMQLLATDRPVLPVEDRIPPAPVALHYTAKASLAEAYVLGRAVRAVCGQWWVPVGDGTTHSTLPICHDCDREAPFAQTVRDLLGLPEPLDQD